ncbi:MAG: DUF721 domain-containing protein [Thermodesulfovibrionales bacterium]|nr:DUF721 domain-containing protein [Thermodesulfovibrionales bacterium]
MERAGLQIHSIMKGLGLEDGLRFYRIMSCWDETFQPPLSLHMRPARLKEAELLINVDSPLWLQQISFLKEDIIGRLGPFGVKKIRLRLGSTGAPLGRNLKRNQEGS